MKFVIYKKKNTKYIQSNRNVFKIYSYINFFSEELEPLISTCS